MFRWFAVLTLLCFPALTSAQVPAQPSLSSLAFLLGTWSAQTSGGGSGGSASGTYTFRRDLAGHAIERTSSADSCSGSKDFDCNHHDRLLIYLDPSGSPQAELKALYLDSEGHVIHYDIAIPDKETVVFQSAPAPGPRFRLVYHHQGTGMSGKFQGAAPGSDEFHSYLEWTGSRQ